MSLVDYASSSDEEEEEVKQAKEEEENKDPKQPESPLPPPQDSQNHQSVISSSFQQSNTSSHSSDPSIEKLPDASMLLNSPTFSSHQMSSDDHSSRVAAAMAESASRKRESNGSMLPPRSKLPKGNLLYSRKVPVPDTVGGLLVPPQLRGRSNVVTEDIGKLFVSRHADTKG
ncbi:anion exchange protein 3 isoform X1 [Cinnamomum micranthum f. kanehirae]|uniref:Anion exchange protein 3 isoform X1 n=1 Tax=Cinnamomum micranthum f. kanehirae TaxID=337451 RepID=A0A3S3M093_9MAGN|nr:anion exchange protein 3 isoform X1 [Cinnamomum micranthum f. kanehirae]